MKSIRFYLITTILAAMTLLVFLSALHGYNNSTKEAKNLLDKQLVDMAADRRPEASGARVGQFLPLAAW
jgi:hypothetical protein